MGVAEDPVDEDDGKFWQAVTRSQHETHPGLFHGVPHLHHGSQHEANVLRARHSRTLSDASVAQVERPEQLRVLRLDGLRLSRVSDHIARLTSLVELKLHNNTLTSAGVGSALAVLTALQTLELSSNPLGFVPTSVCSLRSLRKLDAQFCAIAHLPSDLSRLGLLEELYVNNNDLDEIPASIGHLASLRVLYAHFNSLVSLDAAIGACTDLQELGLHNNRLCSLPGTLTSLARLNLLDLRFNRLSSLPPRLLANTPQLQALLLVDNQLTQLPADVGMCASLTDLLLRRNSLAALPPTLGYATALTQLTFDLNRIDSVPMQLGRLTRLQNLLLTGNRFTCLPHAVLTLPRRPVCRGPSEVLEHLAACTPDADPVLCVDVPVISLRAAAAKAVLDVVLGVSPLAVSPLSPLPLPCAADGDDAVSLPQDLLHYLAYVDPCSHCGAACYQPVARVFGNGRVFSTLVPSSAILCSHACIAAVSAAGLHSLWSNDAAVGAFLF